MTMRGVRALLEMMEPGEEHIVCFRNTASGERRDLPVREMVDAGDYMMVLAGDNDRTMAVASLVLLSDTPHDELTRNLAFRVYRRRDGRIVWESKRVAELIGRGERRMVDGDDAASDPAAHLSSAHEADIRAIVRTELDAFGIRYSKEYAPLVANVAAMTAHYPEMRRMLGELHQLAQQIAAAAKTATARVSMRDGGVSVTLTPKGKRVAARKRGSRAARS